MNPTEKQEDIEKSICWANSPPAPIPGMYYIEPQIKHDFSSFDGSLEEVVPKRLYTDLVEALGIDLMEIVMEHGDGTDVSRKESWLRKPDQISEEFFRNQEKRSEMLKRERIKKDMSEMFDYQKYIQESFEDVNDIVHPTDKTIKVAATFDLFPENIERVIVQSDCAELNPKTSFEVEEDGLSKLFSRANMPDGSVLTCLPQRINDFISFHIRDGNAYYSEIPTLYRLQEHKKQKKRKASEDE